MYMKFMELAEIDINGYESWCFKDFLMTTYLDIFVHKSEDVKY